MAFPSSSGSRPNNLSYAWDRARSIAGEIKDRTNTAHIFATGSGAPSGIILEHAALLADLKQELLIIASLPGIAEYATAQLADPTLDVAADFTAMVSAMDAITSWVVTNYPKDASGFLLAKTFDPNNSGRQVERVFDAATLSGSGYVALLEALLATIN